MTFNIEDYKTVPERIAEFAVKHPDGSLQRIGELQFVSYAGADWVIYTAAAYRSPDDPRPGMGTAWERIPGTTPYTKGSEIQNAETSAWGRAIVAALAADTSKGVASQDEVKLAQARQSPPAGPSKGDVERALTELSSAQTLKELQEAWERAALTGATRDDAVVKAKDDMKGVLS